MVQKGNLVILLSLLVALLLAVPALADTSLSDKINTGHISGVTVQVWKDSSDQEQKAFLLGFMTMLEMEKRWQGKNQLPFKQSLVSSWSMGLSDLTFDQIDATLDNYAINNPQDMQRQVVEVLWFQLVQPKLIQQPSVD